jgi:hypothetical protein
LEFHFLRKVVELKKKRKRKEKCPVECRNIKAVAADRRAQQQSTKMLRSL